MLDYAEISDQDIVCSKLQPRKTFIILDLRFVSVYALVYKLSVYFRYFINNSFDINAM